MIVLFSLRATFMKTTKLLATFSAAAILLGTPFSAIAGYSTHERFTANFIDGYDLINDVPELIPESMSFQKIDPPEGCSDKGTWFAVTAQDTDYYNIEANLHFLKNPQKNTYEALPEKELEKIFIRRSQGNADGKEDENYRLLYISTNEISKFVKKFSFPTFTYSSEVTDVEGNKYVGYCKHSGSLSNNWGTDTCNGESIDKVRSIIRGVENQVLSVLNKCLQNGDPETKNVRCTHNGCLTADGGETILTPTFTIDQDSIRFALSPSKDLPEDVYADFTFTAKTLTGTTVTLLLENVPVKKFACSNWGEDWPQDVHISASLQYSEEGADDFFIAVLTGEGGHVLLGHNLNNQNKLCTYSNKEKNTTAFPTCDFATTKAEQKVFQMANEIFTGAPIRKEICQDLRDAYLNRFKSPEGTQ